MKREQLQNLRGGVVYEAAGVNANTARAWVDSNGLQIGFRESEAAHPRYDLGDAAKLTLMRMLTCQFAMRAGSAARIVNAVQGEIAMVANSEILRVTGEEVAPFPYCIVSLSGVSNFHKPVVRTPEEHARALRDQAIAIETVIDLRSLVALTLDTVRAYHEIPSSPLLASTPIISTVGAAA